MDSTSNGGDRPLTPGESLALIEREQHELQRRLGGSPTSYFLPWGTAYLVGFAVVYAGYDTPLPFRLSPVVAGVVTAVLFAAALTLSIRAGSQVGQGLSGPTRVSASMHNVSWPLGFVALFAVNTGLSRHGLSEEALTLLWTGTSLLVVGLLQLAAAASSQDRLTYGLGVWVLVTAAVSVLAGVPENFAVLSLMGGGGMLVAALVHSHGDRRPA